MDLRSDDVADDKIIINIKNLSNKDEIRQALGKDFKEWGRDYSKILSIPASNLDSGMSNSSPRKQVEIVD